MYAWKKSTRGTYLQLIEYNSLIRVHISSISLASLESSTDFTFSRSFWIVVKDDLNWAARMYHWWAYKNLHKNHGKEQRIPAFSMSRCSTYLSWLHLAHFSPRVYFSVTNGCFEATTVSHRSDKPFWNSSNLQHTPKSRQTHIRQSPCDVISLHPLPGDGWIWTHPIPNFYLLLYQSDECCPKYHQ